MRAVGLGPLGTLAAVTDRDREDASRSRDALRTGGEATASALGAVLGSVAGPEGSVAGAALAPVAARPLRWALDEFHARVLAPRERGRVEKAAWIIIEEMRAREAGDRPRDDGFFDDYEDRLSDAAELLEGTLLHAARQYEERKVRHIALLWPNIERDTTISAAHANHLLKVADRVTYRQLAILAFFAEAQRPRSKWELAVIDLIGARSATGALPSRSLLAEMDELSSFGLLGVVQDGGLVAPVQATVGGGRFTASLLERTHLTPLGETLHQVLSLSLVPETELEAVLEAMNVVPPNSAE